VVWEAWLRVEAEDMRECDYPNCDNSARFKVTMPRGDLWLCREHLDLFKFIDWVLMLCEVEIYLRKRRPEAG